MSHATLSVPLAIGTLAQLTPTQRVFFGYLADYEGNTRALYEYHLGQFLTWCQDVRVDPLDLDRTHAALYVRHLSDDRGLRASSINTAMTPVKGMYRWALLEGFIDRDPVVHVKLPKVDYRQKYPLDRDELRKFRSAAKRLGGRHWVLGELLITQALRISECTGLLVENCTQVERGYRVMTFRAKGGGWHTVPMPVDLQLAIADAVGDRTHGRVITTKAGGPLTRAGAAGLVNTITRHAKIDRHVNPHLVRASVVTELLDSGGDIREAQRLARHEDPRTTSRHYDLSKRNHSTHPSHIMSARLMAVES